MPPEKPGGSMWLEWYEARGEWYEEWAKDTKRYFSDMDSQHELFLLDGIGNAIGENIECYGINFRHLTEYFDVVMLYAMPSGFDKPDVDMDKILSAVDFMNSSSKRFSINKKIAFDFHVYQPFGDDFDRVSSWPYPSLEQIKRITEQAVKSGADMIDHYGYRIGNWRLKNIPPYPLVPEVKTMLRYRTDLWEGLREFNRTLK